MAGEFISISSMMQYMNQGLPFSIVYITYDKALGKGGAVKRVDMATKCWTAQPSKAGKAEPSPSGGGGVVRNPNHFQNSTTNIRISAAGQADIRKVHIQLIRQFNGAIVK